LSKTDKKTAKQVKRLALLVGPTGEVYRYLHGRPAGVSVAMYAQALEIRRVKAEELMVKAYHDFHPEIVIKAGRYFLRRYYR